MKSQIVVGDKIGARLIRNDEPKEQKEKKDGKERAIAGNGKSARKAD